MQIREEAGTSEISPTQTTRECLTHYEVTFRELCKYYKTYTNNQK